MDYGIESSSSHAFELLICAEILGIVEVFPPTSYLISYVVRPDRVLYGGTKSIYLCFMPRHARPT